ncbi:AlbA family DNA-binding domain-containing protein [Dictyobacter formicarum]|uniref:Schlafen AlbA-2 domain-containing protein n=1 Tax=Dictyobacter formicarum TaxID=2778368 RepID=A0ABQ3VGV4_9CHLR|nr:ATP-binding protein [Dictyobacter formicarum]GHO84361.1 hypothetical protein KSZ_23670 [Dictyobacter formicarum]
MNNSYNDQELAAQLQLDLTEGESWHIEFKEYDHARLNDKIADSWKDDLSDELAAFGSIGGKIYIGISDDGTVKGIGGSHQIWQEKLFERAMGRVKPKVKWKSYYFTDPTTGSNLIRIDVFQDEPVYYIMKRPYIREGTTSRPAEPEEVKALFREYFTNREPSLPTEDANNEASALVSWVTDVLMNILSSLNLYEQKSVDPRLEQLKIELERHRELINANLNKVKRAFGEQSEYYQALETISGEILAALNVRLFADGGKSWSEWLGYLKKVYDTTSELLSTVKANVSIAISGLNEQEGDVRDATVRWLHSIDDFNINKFTYEASQYVHILLRLHFLLWLSNEQQKASHYKEITDEIERLSWARSNVDYWAIREAIPDLIRKLSTTS